MKKIIQKIKTAIFHSFLDDWVAQNPEPLWTGGYTHNSRGNPVKHEEWKVWSIAHAQWTRKLEKYLGIYKGY